MKDGLWNTISTYSFSPISDLLSLLSYSVLIKFLLSTHHLPFTVFAYDTLVLTLQLLWLFLNQKMRTLHNVVSLVQMEHCYAFGSPLALKAELFSSWSPSPPTFDANLGDLGSWRFTLFVLQLLCIDTWLSNVYNLNFLLGAHVLIDKYKLAALTV